MLSSLILVWVVNFTGSDSENLNPKWRFCLKLARNEETKMIKKSALLTENSVSESHLTQSFCM